MTLGGNIFLNSAIWVTSIFSFNSVTVDWELGLDISDEQFAFDILHCLDNTFDIILDE